MGRRRRQEPRNLRTLTGRGRGATRGTRAANSSVSLPTTSANSSATTGRNERQTRAQTRAMEELIQSNNANQAQAIDASSNASNDEQVGRRVQVQQQQDQVRPRPEAIVNQPRDVARVNEGASTSGTVASNHGNNQPNQDAQQLAPPDPPRVEANRLLQGNITLRTNPANVQNTLNHQIAGTMNNSSVECQVPVGLVANNNEREVTNQLQGANNSSNSNSNTNLVQDVANVPLPVQTGITDNSYDLFRQQQLGFTPLMSAFTPLGTGVAQSIKAKIIKGEYVDLVTLVEKKDPYMQYHENQGIALSVNQSGQIIWKSNKPKQMITSISAWTSAFLIFTSVYLSAHPTRTQELLKYMHLVRTAASRYGGFGWRSYDQQFRLRMQEYPQRSWAVIDNELWSLYMTQSSVVASTFPMGIRQQGQNVGGFQPQFSNRQAGNSGFRTQFSNTGWKSKEKICFDFNKKTCQRKPCMYKHKCMHCKESGHGAIDCKKS